MNAPHGGSDWKFTETMYDGPCPEDKHYTLVRELR
ncbi:unnamed protein product [Ectocarpus sp. CCAP 1310/34]|nr:unnamed protein product [Ectocarpus sp. CCAP 1310/34]